MPKMRGETNQQWMDRLKEYREREAMMARTRAAVAYIDTARSAAQQERLKLFAFMDIFHPEVSDEEVRRLAR